MARSRRTPAMLVSRCSSQLSSHKLQAKSKKSHASERSALQIHRMTQRSVRGVEEPVLSVAEGTPGLLVLPMPFVPFPTPKPVPGGLPRFFPGAESKKGSVLLCTAATSTSWAATYWHAFACASITSRNGENRALESLGGRKGANSLDKISIVGVLRLRAPNAVHPINL